MVLLFVGFTIRYLYEYRKYLLDIYYIQNISMCRNTEKKCMHYENGIKDEKNIWKNLSLTWHNQGIEKGIEQGIEKGRLEERTEGLRSMVETVKSLVGDDFKKVCEIIKKNKLYENVSEEEIKKFWK